MSFYSYRGQKIYLMKTLVIRFKFLMESDRTLQLSIYDALNALFIMINLLFTTVRGFRT